MFVENVDTCSEIQNAVRGKFVESLRRKEHGSCCEKGSTVELPNQSGELEEAHCKKERTWGGILLPFAGLNSRFLAIKVAKKTKCSRAAVPKL